MELKKYGLHQVELDITEGCNLHCDFCGLAGMAKELHFMSKETVIKVCQLLKDSGLSPRIHLIGHGEPTLNPNLCEIIRIVREMLPHSKITVSTNGFSILREQYPEKKIQQYFDAGLDTITIDEYLHNNLDAFRAYLTEKGIPYSENITDSFAPKAERIRINPPIETNSKRALSARCGAAFAPPCFQMPKKCSKIFRELFIRWDGNVGLCCEDFRGEYEVVNIHSVQSLAEAWNHPRLEAARKFLYEGRRIFHPCELCNVEPNRPGLLPDWTGKGTMPKPKQLDYGIVTYRTKPLAKIVRRNYEHSN